MRLGYARVSKSDGSQVIDLQIDALTKARVKRAKIFSDTASGSKAERPGLDELLAFAREGDEALGARIEAGDVVTVDSFEVPDRKTKSFVAQLVGAAGTENALVISDKFSEETHLAGRNLATAGRITASDVSTEQILFFDKLVITAGALPILAKRTDR